MASEPRCSKPGCSALKIVGKPCTDADCPQQWVHHTETRPAPAATDTGLVTVAFQHRRIDKYGVVGDWRPYKRDLFGSDRIEGRELVTRSQAVELLAAERAEKEKLEAAWLEAEGIISDLKADNERLRLNADTHQRQFSAANVRAKNMTQKCLGLEAKIAAEIRRERDLAEKQLSEVVDRMSDDYLALKAELDQAVGVIEDRSSEYEALEAKLAAAHEALRTARDYLVSDLAHEKEAFAGYEKSSHIPEMERDIAEIDAVLGGKPS